MVDTSVKVNRKPKSPDSATVSDWKSMYRYLEADSMVRLEGGATEPQYAALPASMVGDEALLPFRICRRWRVWCGTTLGNDRC